MSDGMFSDSVAQIYEKYLGERDDMTLRASKTQISMYIYSQISALGANLRNHWIFIAYDHLFAFAYI